MAFLLRPWICPDTGESVWNSARHLLTRVNVVAFGSSTIRGKDMEHTDLDNPAPLSTFWTTLLLRIRLIVRWGDP